jgi:hypothetical protein
VFSNLRLSTAAGFSDRVVGCFQVLGANTPAVSSAYDPDDSGVHARSIRERRLPYASYEKRDPGCLEDAARLNDIEIPDRESSYALPIRVKYPSGGLSASACFAHCA